MNLYIVIGSIDVAIFNDDLAAKMKMFMTKTKMGEEFHDIKFLLFIVIG